MTSAMFIRAPRAHHSLRHLLRLDGTAKARLGQHHNVSRQIHSIQHEGFEEHCLLRFHDKRYYPVRIGQLFNDRYRILAKLGFGAYSTVWLTRDVRTQQYASLKVCNFTDPQALTSGPRNEGIILRHLTMCSQDHAGATLSRQAQDTFVVDGHECFVMKPQGCSPWHFLHMVPDGRLPSDYMKTIVMSLLSSVNWLHSNCGVIHTEITANNVLMRADVDSLFRRIESEEVQKPSVPFFDRAHPHPHPIYTSRGDVVEKHDLDGVPILSDFGTSRINSISDNRGWCMTDLGRAPEMLMDVPWDYQVDIWSIGMLMLECLEGRGLFSPPSNDRYNFDAVLAQYISYLGLPPLWMIRQSDDPHIARFFDKHGQWIGKSAIHPNALEKFVTVIPPGKEKKQFMELLKKTFTWDPRARAVSNELFEDEWLSGDMRRLGLM